MFSSVCAITPAICCWNSGLVKGPASISGERLPISTATAGASTLRKVRTGYGTHFNGHRPHRALNQASPLRALADPVEADLKVIRRDRLGGLLHEYSQVA